MTGRFITLEGGEGTGKSTQAKRLGSRLRAAGRSVLETREPGGSPFAERLRALLLDPATPPHGALSEALLFAAARADHVATTIRPALEAGTWVICDRFADSTRVYQGSAGGLDPNVVAELEALVVGPTRPDLTLVLDLDATLGLARAARRRGALGGGPAGDDAADTFEQRDLAFHERLRQGFLQLAGSEPNRVAVIDAGQSMDDVARDVWAAVSMRLGLGVS